jgi:DNA replication protein DnaC
MSFSTTVNSNCGVCDGTGWRPLSHEIQRSVMRCECRGDARAARLKSALPPLYHNARLTDFGGPFKDTAEQWLRNPTFGLLVCGPIGSGKTHFAAAIVRALIESSNAVIFKSAADLYEELRAAFNSTDAEATERVVMSRLTDAAFIVLDDVGAGSLSDHERRSTLHLLDRRLNCLRPTIVTTNLTLEEIGRLMDGRIASRLSGFTRIAVTGRDRRAGRN